MYQLNVYQNKYSGEICKFKSIDRKGIVTMEYISGKTGTFVQEEGELIKQLLRNWEIKK